MVLMVGGGDDGGVDGGGVDGGGGVSVSGGEPEADVGD